MERINKYYDFNGYLKKTTDDLKWGLYFDNNTDVEMTLIFNKDGECLGVEKKEDIRILNTMEDIPYWEEFSIKGY